MASASTHLSTSSPERELVVSTPRYDACRILKAAGIAFCIWAEDALTAYGVPTVCFELYLMTDNVAGAVEALVQKGYIQKAPEKNHPTLISELSTWTMWLARIKEYGLGRYHSTRHNRVELHPCRHHYDMASAAEQVHGLLDVQVDG